MLQLCRDLDLLQETFRAECGSEIEEHNKPKILARGRWVAKYPAREKRGYHINGLYAPIGLGSSWAALAENWLESHKDPVKLKRFVNTVLGEAWEDQARKVKTSELAERAAITMSRVLGDQNVHVMEPLMAAEDFAYFANIVPGFYINLGTTKPGTTSGWNHTPNFMADDGSVPVGMRVMSNLLLDYLQAQSSRPEN